MKQSRSFLLRSCIQRDSFCSNMCTAPEDGIAQNLSVVQYQQQACFRLPGIPKPTLHRRKLNMVMRRISKGMAPVLSANVAGLEFGLQFHSWTKIGFSGSAWIKAISQIRFHTSHGPEKGCSTETTNPWANLELLTVGHFVACTAHSLL